MKTIADVMTPNPRTVSAGDSLLEAARVMRDDDIGDVIIIRDEQVAGIVTDRDIVIRGIALGHNPEETKIGDVASQDIVTVSPDEPLDRAVSLMRDKAIRRLPVCDEEGKPVGVVSLGDLAVERDPESVLGEVSAAPPNE
jgi:CBS domain-containing protein